MKVYENFRYTGAGQRWEVPDGILNDEAFFECWGASGGMASRLYFAGKERETKGGSAPRNDDFTNDPRAQGRLGVSHANNAGYAAGFKKVKAGETYHIYVGGNGGPGHSSIRRRTDGTFYVRARGGTAGFNGGGSGGAGKRTDRNLFNSAVTKVHFSQNGIPAKANKGQLWHDTDGDRVYRAKRNYSGGGQLSYWEQVTHIHTVSVGPSGGGGGGATDIRRGGDSLGHRILVAGGGGGSAGQLSFKGDDAWNLQACPGAPVPPFGEDDVSTGPRGLNSTWAARINYLTGGWGRGGVGGAAQPLPGTLPTTNGGTATRGGSGGPGTNRHKEGVKPTIVHGSAGKGGEAVKGGEKGKGGSGAEDGSLGQGGKGANATGLTAGSSDDWCAGGGGGGGGFYGGGGGGQGFIVAGESATTSDTRTHGGGGGGGSNYASPQMDSAILLGCARPPRAGTSKPTGANGRGGFARISYALPPKTTWTAVPTTAIAGQNFGVSFKYSPAISGGAKIDFYVIGTGIAAAEFPTTQSVINVSDKNQTSFVYDGFVGPTAGAQTAIFVKTVDQDGDSSPWVKHLVTGVAAPVPATITSPAEGSQFIDSALVQWTPGAQSPLIAYRLGLQGEDLLDPSTVRDYPSRWKAGGSRVNLATDPGFKGSAVWFATYDPSGAARVLPSATFPGVSGSSGRAAWTATTNEDAENFTTPWNNLIPGIPYRFSLKVASGTANDTRGTTFEVADENGSLVTHYEVGYSTGAAGTYASVEVRFTPSGQNVVLSVRPEDSDGITGNAEIGQITYLKDLLLEMDFASETLLAEEFDFGGVAVSNLVHNPSAESNIDGYGVAFGETLSHDTTTGFYGSASVKSNRGTVGNQYIYYNYDGTPGTLIEATPGLVYQGSVRLKHSATGTFICALNFWDSSGVLLGNASSVTGTVAAGTWREATTPLAEAPANTAYISIGAGRASTSGDLWADWFVVNEGGSVTDAHDPPAEWQSLTGNGGQIIPDAAGRESEGAIKYRAGGGSDIVEHADPLGIAVYPGKTYTFTGWAFADTTSRNAHAQIDWRDSGGLFISSSVGSTVSVPLNDWASMSVTGVAPATAVYAHVAIEFEDALVNEVFYLDDLTLSSVSNPSYFDGTNLNGNVGAASWYGGADASASVLTGTDVVADTLTLVDLRLGNGLLYLDTYTDDTLILGGEHVRADISVLVNPIIPATPTVALTVNHSLGVMSLVIDADDAASDYSTTSFDIFRNGVRIVTGLTPDPVTRLAYYTDVPAHGEHAVYTVRALAVDPAAPNLRPGYTDVSDGTVTTVN